MSASKINLQKNDCDLKRLGEIKKDLPELSEEKRPTMKKDIREMITEFKNSKLTKKEKNLKRFWRE